MKKKRKKREGGAASGALTKLAHGASAEANGCEVTSRTARGGGRASEELWAALEQGVEPKGRESKERDGNRGTEENNGRGDVGWIENNSISLKVYADVFMRENREREVIGNVVYWEVNGG